jgi:predicted dehydrogenase
MKVVVVGMGVQGAKRRANAGADYACSVDPVRADADYKSIQDVPLARYDAALVCTPDEPKAEVLGYLLANGKHVLVEKPLWTARDDEIAALERSARAENVVCYTAYNHRFEPHFVRMRDAIASGALGEIYHCRMFYGNGTARLVRDSAWRDQGAGVVPDLGSHLLDTAWFWFGQPADDFSVIAARSFENRAPDHVIVGSRRNRPQIELEMTLLSWRNHYTCDVFGEKGSAHISSLCKWGPSTFTLRTRVLPSGRPLEEPVTLEQPDPTCALEYAHFKHLCESGARTDLSRDLWLQRTLRGLGDRAVALAAKGAA